MSTEELHAKIAATEKEMKADIKRLWNGRMIEMNDYRRWRLCIPDIGEPM